MLLSGDGEVKMSGLAGEGLEGGEGFGGVAGKLWGWQVHGVIHIS